MGLAPGTVALLFPTGKRHSDGRGPWICLLELPDRHEDTVQEMQACLSFAFGLGPNSTGHRPQSSPCSPDQCTPRCWHDIRARNPCHIPTWPSRHEHFSLESLCNLLQRCPLTSLHFLSLPCCSYELFIMRKRTPAPAQSKRAKAIAQRGNFWAACATCRLRAMKQKIMAVRAHAPKAISHLQLQGLFHPICIAWTHALRPKHHCQWWLRIKGHTP